MRKIIKPEHCSKLFNTVIFFLFLTNASAQEVPVLEWAKAMGGTNEDTGYSIAIDASGNVLTTGHFIGTSDFDPGTGTFDLTSAGLDDIFISKLDASGNFVWAKQLGGTSTPAFVGEEHRQRLVIRILVGEEHQRGSSDKQNRKSSW